ncbi:DUF732 domain-containing protein [Mycolicibacterium fortuitum]|nr:DUF732 domain-containing protein [Mycolicibacterium fortuitum]
MPSVTRSTIRRLGIRFGQHALLAVSLGLALTTAPTARADDTAYLINVHVRPGYAFADAAAALAYGNGICRRLSAAEGYPAIMGTVRADLRTADEYDAAYLINQAANELCPVQIWQLRTTAAGYQPPVDSTS